MYSRPSAARATLMEVEVVLADRLGPPAVAAVGGDVGSCRRHRWRSPARASANQTSSSGLSSSGAQWTRSQVTPPSLGAQDHRVVPDRPAELAVVEEDRRSASPGSAPRPAPRSAPPSPEIRMWPRSPTATSASVGGGDVEQQGPRRQRRLNGLLRGSSVLAPTTAELREASSQARSDAATRPASGRHRTSRRACPRTRSHRPFPAKSSSGSTSRPWPSRRPGRARPPSHVRTQRLPARRSAAGV